VSLDTGTEQRGPAVGPCPVLHSLELARGTCAALQREALLGRNSGRSPCLLATAGRAAAGTWQAEPCARRCAMVRGATLSREGAPASASFPAPAQLLQVDPPV